MALERRNGLAIATLVTLIGVASAQPLPPANIPNAPPPPPSNQPNPFPQQAPRPQNNPFPQQNQSNSSAICQRLEASLQQLNRGPSGPNSETLARYEDAIVKQRQELDQAMGTARRLGCERRGFFIFGGSQRPEQCNQLEPQIDRMRANLDRMQQEVSQIRGGNDDANYTRDLQRRQLLVSLNQNNCGPQYRNVAAPPTQRPRGFLDRIFGNNDENPDVAPNDMPEGTGFRTVCVRLCDGAFFPISFATVQSRFGDDEALCKRQCPAAEVALYHYSNPGQDIEQAVSQSGEFYSSLPNAFKYRTEFNPSCSCRGPGQSWAEALGQDQTIQRGDIIVTEQRSKQLSQPKVGPLAQPTAQQKQQQTKNPNTPLFEPPTPTPTAAETPLPPEKPDAKRKVRVVGPQFFPTRPVN
jgi:hypothetical protein